MKAFVRNTATSIFTTGLDYATFAALFELAHLDYRLSTLIGTLVGALSNFLINRQWSYEAAGEAGDGAHRQFLRFLPVQAGSSALQTGGVWLFTGALGLPPLISKLVASATVYLIWNFPMNRYFVFRKPRA